MDLVLTNLLHFLRRELCTNLVALRSLSISCHPHALASMLHSWTQVTDGSSAAVRVVLFDYSKAFDLIDHNLLVRKIFNLSIPQGVALWVVDFLTQRYQRVST